MRISPEVLDHFIPRFLKDGWQVVCMSQSFKRHRNLTAFVQNVHAIGDRANGLVLDAFEKALKTVKVDVASLRPRLEHAQILTKEDMKRVGDLGGALSVNCSPWTERLKQERI